MSADIILVIVTATALAFDFTNGFHDTANVVATAISTRAIAPKPAVAIAALLNFVGAFLSLKVAATVGQGFVDTDAVTTTVVFAGLVGAIGWNLITWYFGLPSSSSHALIGGLVGAALFAPHTKVYWTGIYQKVVVPMVVSPLVGIALGYLVMLGVMWIFRRGNPGTLTRGFRHAQTASAAAMAFGHGLQDAAKTMGIVVLALVTGGLHHGNAIPIWVYFLTAGVLALGTYSGGWRVIRTLGRRIIHLDPPQGFAAETTASVILYVATYFKLPISTTHTITSAIMGVGATKRLSAVRWNVAYNIVGAWIFTFPGAGGVAALAYFLVGRVFS
jgi:inorganic phosphate transporter, PiT family